MINRKTIGKIGETDTVAYLEKRDYRIIDTNVRPIGGRSRGEIDIIAWHGDYLVFIEVKTRTNYMIDGIKAVESVDLRKRRQLTKLSSAYITRYKLYNVPCRFDVVEVYMRGTISPRINIIANAFSADDI